MSWKLEGEADSGEAVRIIITLGCVPVTTMLSYAAVTNYPLNVHGLHGKI